MKYFSENSFQNIIHKYTYTYMYTICQIFSSSMLNENYQRKTLKKQSSKDKSNKCNTTKVGLMAKARAKHKDNASHWKKKDMMCTEL